MVFRTEVPIEKQRLHLIDYESKLFLVGSCFSDSVGGKFKDSGFLTTSNPLGVLFHPIAIERFLTRAINEEFFIEKDLEMVNVVYCSLEAHSQFNHTQPKEILSQLNESLTTTKNEITSATHVFITLGTAWVYRFIATDSIVANCHKISQKKFLKELLSIEEVKNSLEAIVALVNQINPKVQFVFTVSPVRHLKDGFIENNRSKSHLIAATQSIVENLDNCHYFPSYEIVLDELRDYRFYKTDMVHPSDQAIDFIWQKFQDSWLTEEAIDLLKDVLSVKKGFAHKAFNPESAQHKEFLRSLVQKKDHLLKIIPHLSF